MENKGNKEFKMFLFGALSVMFLYPVLYELSNVMLQWVEYLKIFPTKMITKGNSEIADLQEELVNKTEEVSTNVIGFQLPSSSDDYDDWDDE